MRRQPAPPSYACRKLEEELERRIAAAANLGDYQNQLCMGHPGSIVAYQSTKSLTSKTKVGVAARRLTHDGLHDSPLEGNGFELPVPRAIRVWFRDFALARLW